MILKLIYIYAIWKRLKKNDIKQKRGLKRYKDKTLLTLKRAVGLIHFCFHFRKKTLKLPDDQGLFQLFFCLIVRKFQRFFTKVEKVRAFSFFYENEKCIKPTAAFKVFTRLLHRGFKSKIKLLWKLIFNLKPHFLTIK